VHFIQYLVFPQSRYLGLWLGVLDSVLISCCLSRYLGLFLVCLGYSMSLSTSRSMFFGLRSTSLSAGISDLVSRSRHSSFSISVSSFFSLQCRSLSRCTGLDCSIPDSVSQWDLGNLGRSSGLGIPAWMTRYLGLSLLLRSQFPWSRYIRSRYLI